MVDMTFIHRLESAIMEVLANEQPTAAFDTSLRAERSKDAKAFSKKVAQELYFRLDASMLIDLATLKLAEPPKPPTSFACRSSAAGASAARRSR